MTVTLHQFPFSNFCEKAVWALDHMQVPYRVQMHYPGPHFRSVKRISGQTAVPVIEDGEDVICGSAQLIAHLNKRGFGDDLVLPEHRAAVLKWQSRVDEIGGVLRGVLFCDIFPQPTVALRLLTAGEHGYGMSRYGLFFRLMVPMLHRLTKKEMPDPDAAAQRCRDVLDDIAETASGTGYLVGDRFTLADLAAAAIFSPICFAIGSLGHDYARGNQALERWTSRWEGHPGIDWVEAIYARHRSPQKADEGRVLDEISSASA